MTHSILLIITVCLMLSCQAQGTDSQVVEVADTTENEPIFSTPEVWPRLYFPECEAIDRAYERRSCISDSLSEWYRKHLYYPISALQDSIEGTVVVEFNVDTFGHIDEPYVVHSPLDQLSKEAIRWVKLLPDWILGKLGDKPVPMLMRFPVRFKLAEASSSRVVDTDTLPPIIYERVDQMPRFYSEECVGLEGSAADQCATKEMMLWLTKRFRIPEEARKNEIDGTPVVEYTVTPTGTIDDVVILRNPGGGIGEALQQLVQRMPDWQPGSLNGVPVAVRMRLPLRYCAQRGRQEDND